jgi:preprotein translocase subunit YajC
MTHRLSLLTAALLAVSTPSLVDAAPTPGMQVKDASGGMVGSVIKSDATMVTVKTDKYEIPLPVASFTPDGQVLLLGMSQAQLNAEWEKIQAASAASLVVGAPVKGSKGTQVGTIEAIDDQSVTIALSSGKKVQLPRNGIAGSPSGAVIGFSAEELEAKLAGAGAQ